MAINIGTIRDWVRERIRDADPRKASFSTPELDSAISSAYLALQARLPAPDLYTAAAFTISAGADTFTLPATVTQWTGNDGGAEYAGDIRIQLASNGQFLNKLSMYEMDAIRDGNATIPQGIPDRFAIWEDKDQGLNGRCYPAAKSAESCNLYAKLTASDLRDFVGAGGTSTLDDVEVLFSRIAAQALELYVAADLLFRMTEEDLKARRINPTVAKFWREESMTLIRHERVRRRRLDSTGRTQRWVA